MLNVSKPTLTSEENQPIWSKELKLAKHSSLTKCYKQPHFCWCARLLSSGLISQIHSSGLVFFLQLLFPAFSPLRHFSVLHFHFANSLLMGLTPHKAISQGMKQCGTGNCCKPHHSAWSWMCLSHFGADYKDRRNKNHSSPCNHPKAESTLKCISCYRSHQQLPPVPRMLNILKFLHYKVFYVRIFHNFLPFSSDHCWSYFLSLRHTVIE